MMMCAPRTTVALANSGRARRPGRSERIQRAALRKLASRCCQCVPRTALGSLLACACSAYVTMRGMFTQRCALMQHHTASKRMTRHMMLSRPFYTPL